VLFGRELLPMLGIEEVIRCGAVWCGVVRCGAVCCGVVRCSVWGRGSNFKEGIRTNINKYKQIQTL